MVNDNLLDFKMIKRLEKQLFCGTENTMDLLFIFFSDMKWEFWHNSLLPVCFSIKNFQVQKIRFWTMVGTLPPAPQVLRCRVLRLFLFQSRNSNSVCSWASAGERANFVTFLTLNCFELSLVLLEKTNKLEKQIVSKQTLFIRKIVFHFLLFWDRVSERPSRLREVHHLTSSPKCWWRGE